MSIATINPATAAAKVPTRAIVRRFVWKELRVLVALWLAVVVLGVIIQAAVNILSPPSADHPALLLSTALAAAVLYAVGAAATTFSVEHEEETYGFLVGLPTTWWPVYMGKLEVVAGSAIALAGCLSLIGWMVSGFDTPGARDSWIIVGLFGIAILEGIAWGTLFSILLKRPLTAAILTLVVATAAVNLAVYLTSWYPGANLKPIAYAEAFPLRLAIVAVVLVCGALVARRWLTVGESPDRTTNDRARFWWRMLPTRIAGRFWSRAVSLPSPPRGKVMARLLWQTWRDSGKLLALPIGIAAVLVAGTAAAIILTHPAKEIHNAVWTSTILFVPALYGAMAFSADQRRGSYRFLAEHAARPRYVWLARHVVWLGTVILLSLALWLIFTAFVAFVIQFLFQRDLEDYVRWGSMPEIGFQLPHQTLSAISVVSFTWYGVFAAYAVGQFCSMLLRSEILAAFIALVVSVLICAWAAVLFAWQLSGAMFLLPVAAALMFATWLRAPDWLAERNSWRAWLTPALAVAATLVVTGIALPYARLAQIDNQPTLPTQLYMRSEPSTIDVESLVAAHRARATPEARETAAMYLRAVEALYSWEANDPLERWRKSENAQNSSTSAIGFDEAKIPPDQQAAFLKAKERWSELVSVSRAAAVKLAIEASSRPTCHFEFDVDEIPVGPIGFEGQLGLDSYRFYMRFNELLSALWADAPETQFDHLLAALRMSVHLRAGQPSVVVLDQLEKEKSILQQIGAWAARDNRTNGERRIAIGQLIDYFRRLPWLPETVIADHVLMTNVLRGHTPSLVLAKKHQSPLDHLAYLANQLPWERERALLALNAITRQNVSDADALEVNLPTLYASRLDSLFARRWLRPRYASGWTEKWLIAQPAAATSYLARLEYQTRVPVHEFYRAYFNSQTYRRAALLRIALAMFRRDHGAYPTLLTELVPDYLDQVPLDPFSGQQFVYRAAGLELPLHRRNWSNFERIEANTPLFWSVGAGNARLEEWEREVSEEDENDLSRDTKVIKETVYVLDSEIPPWSTEPAFAFPLAK
ncbi:MAG: hypothetical protein WD894_18065 [Pirellulales bacterium]